MLNQLGLRAGIHVEPASDMKCEAAYQQAMTNLIKGTTFEKSFLTDPMEEVLSGNRPDVAMLEAWCRGEKLTRKGGKAIGFAS